MIELKPCPFCGGKVELENHRSYPDTFYSISCKGCIFRTEWAAPKERVIEAWNRRAEEEQNTHIEHTVNISTGSITKEELDRYLWERSVDILPYIPHDDTLEISFDEVLDRKIKEAVKKCLEEHYREKEGKE